MPGDGIDSDCDDETVPQDSVDTDADGSDDDVDCNDADASVYPGATEIADDGIDQDCDGTDLVSEPETDPVDSDLDGDPDETDCAPADATIFTGATEELDDLDNDCDSAVDEDWQAYALATYGSIGYYNLNVQTYTDADHLGDVWNESATVSSGTQVEVEFLTAEYDLSSSCGLRLNVSEGNPASDWLCAGGVIDSSVGIDIWFDGSWYNETNLEVWIADSSNGSCALILQVDSASACDPVNDAD